MERMEQNQRRWKGWNRTNGDGTDGENGVFLGFLLQTKHRKLLFIACIAHPCCHILAHALLESEAEGAVAMVAAFAGQLLDGECLPGGRDLLISADEVVNAQIVDIGIVSDALTCEIVAEIGTVGANRMSQLLKSQVVLQVKLCIYAVLSQHLLDLNKVDIEEIADVCLVRIGIT